MPHSNLLNRRVPSMPNTQSAPNACAGVSAPVGRCASTVSTARTPASTVNWHVSATEMFVTALGKVLTFQKWLQTDN